MSVAERLAGLGLRLPDPRQPQGEQVPVVVQDGTDSFTGTVIGRVEATVRKLPIASWQRTRRAR